MKLYNSTLIIVANLVVLNLTAQTFIEPCKYGQPLISALQQNHAPTQTLGYGPARDILYSQIDNVGNDLFGIYTNFKVTLDPNADPSSDAFSKGINAEHVYPQSKGAGSEPMRSDMHNIYPSKVNVNSARGNCPFDDIVDTDTDMWFFEATSTGNIPNNDIDSYSEKDVDGSTFEPRESKKGDIARAVFYFYAIYQNVANNADANFFNIQKNKLLEWHYADLPDATELARSTAIASQQGNENPFAVDTSLARRAFFMSDASYPTNDENCYNIITPTEAIKTQNWITLQTNVIKDIIILESLEQEGTIVVFDLKGQVVRTATLQFQTIINAQDFQSGIYILRVLNRNKVATFRILVQ